MFYKRCDHQHYDERLQSAGDPDDAEELLCRWLIILLHYLALKNKVFYFQQCCKKHINILLSDFISLCSKGQTNFTISEPEVPTNHMICFIIYSCGSQNLHQNNPQ